MGTTSREASLEQMSHIEQAFESEDYHSRAWKCIPAKSDAIAVLDLAPLIFEGLVVHVRRSL